MMDTSAILDLHQEIYGKDRYSSVTKTGNDFDPEFLEFNIAPGADGDITNGLDFTLRMKPADTTGTGQKAPVRQSVKKDTTFMVIHEVTQELVTITEDSYAIQLGAFKVRANAEVLRRSLRSLSEGMQKSLSRIISSKSESLR
ncbi:MAG: SPOR domain-containing protein [Marinilabiliales bacterium]|nr:SPOR domain-containing protein [Marinilabiliales bacterium]